MEVECLSISEDYWRLCVDTAYSRTVWDSYATISMVSPRGAPYVFDEPVANLLINFLALFSNLNLIFVAITYYSQCWVHICTAVLTSNYPISIEKKLWAARCDRDGNRSHWYCNFQLFRVIRNNIDEARDIHFALVLVVLAVSFSLAGLWIYFLEHQGVVLGVLKCVWHQTTIATEVWRITIYELLSR